MSFASRALTVCALGILTGRMASSAEPAERGRAQRGAEITSSWRGVPFRATQKIIRRGPDGVVETRGSMARSSDGSTYVELVDERTKAPTEALIFDVPRHREIVLDLVGKHYTVRDEPGIIGREVPLDFAADQLRVGTIEKDTLMHSVMGGVDSTWRGLGVRRVGGLEAVGSVQVRRPEAAPNEPVDGPAEVDESWLSVDLGIAVLRLRHDPVRGTDTEVALTEIVRAEPSAVIFEVPADFVLESDKAERSRSVDRH